MSYLKNADCSFFGFVFISPAPVIRLNGRPVKRSPAVELIAHHRRFNRRHWRIKTALSSIPHSAFAVIKLTILTSFLSCTHKKPHFLQYSPLISSFYDLPKTSFYHLPPLIQPITSALHRGPTNRQARHARGGGTCQYRAAAALAAAGAGQ